MSHRVRTALACAMVAAATAGCHSGTPAPARIPLPLVEVAQLSLPGDSSRFDYESLDPQRGLLFIAHLGASQLIEVDVRARRVTRTIASIAGVHGVLVVPGLPGCDHDHGLALDPPDRLAFVACDGNAALLTVDLTAWTVTGSEGVGNDPDVLSYDPAARRLFVAAESGWVTVLHLDRDTLHVLGRDHLADGAHVMATDPNSGVTYLPIPHGADGRPALLIEKATP